MTKILIVENNKVTSLEETAFTLEEKLQDYLEEYPSLIPLQDIEESATDLLCIGKEVNIPSGSIDLLFIDSGGVLTLVETKLVKNPEARRTVIGQLIEYASFVSEWTVDKVYKVANDYPGSSLDTYMEQHRNEDSSTDDFKATIEHNLHNGKIRLIVAVDDLIEPLRSTVTFLNAYSSFDIFLLQIKSYEESESRKVLIPSLFGYSKKIKSLKPSRKQWDEERLLMDLKERCEPGIVTVIEDLFEFTKSNADNIYWGTGAVTGSFTFHKLNKEREIVSIFTANSESYLCINFGWMKGRVDEEILESFRAELNNIPDINISKEAISGNKWPSIKAKILADPINLQRFEKAILTFCQAVDAETISQ